jgi:hypothetical protein
MKIGVVKGITTISSDITASRTLTNDTEWHLQGVIYVKNGAVLTIEPGTFVIGQPGRTPPSAVIITVNGRIEAGGDEVAPDRDDQFPALRPASARPLGGLVVLGKAPINVGGNIPGGGIGDDDWTQKWTSWLVETDVKQ